METTTTDTIVLPAIKDPTGLVDLVLDQAVEAYDDWLKISNDTTATGHSVLEALAYLKGLETALAAVLSAEATPAERLVRLTWRARS